jgi:hypothetical protein
MRYYNSTCGIIQMEVVVVIGLIGRICTREDERKIVCDIWNGYKIILLESVRSFLFQLVHIFVITCQTPPVYKREVRLRVNIS